MRKIYSREDNNKVKNKNDSVQNKTKQKECYLKSKDGNASFINKRYYGTVMK
jgi:hypothetical protein